MESIEKVIGLKVQLDALRPIGSEQEAIIMEKFRLDWNYHSNHLEGNSLTFGETKALILFGITAQGKPLKDHFEITGHDEAIKWVIDVVKRNYPLTENFIRELHTLLLKEPYEVPAITADGLPTKKRVEVGKYKSQPNHVLTKTGEVFRFATPEETPAQMGDLLDWYKRKTSDPDVNPVLLAAEFHYKFIRIHPFDDGNGRTARILMNFILMQFGFPPVIIKTEDKENYFSALRQADAGLIEPFIEYIAKNMVRSLEIMIAGANGLSIQEPDDIDKEIALLEQKLKVIGTKIEISKSKEVLLAIYDDSVTRLKSAFIESSKKFDRFYVSAQYNPMDGIINKRNNIENGDNYLALEYFYSGFIQEGFGEFSHHSGIYFSFGLTGYVVKDRNNTYHVSKIYGDQLTGEEINSLVKAEMTTHKQLIEKKLAEIQNARKGEA